MFLLCVRIDYCAHFCRPPSRVSMRPQSKSQSARPSTSPSVIKRKGGAVVQPTTTLVQPVANPSPRYLLPKDAPWRLARDPADYHKSVGRRGKSDRATTPPPTPAQSNIHAAPRPPWKPSALLDLQRSISPDGKKSGREGSRSAGNSPLRASGSGGGLVGGAVSRL